MNWQVVVGPRSWNERLWGQVKAELERLGLSFELHRTARESDVSRVVEEARAAGRSHFVAMGGDGAMNVVLNAMLSHSWETRPVLGVIPAGTGSDFIRMFAIPQDAVEAVSHLQGERVYRSDVGLIEGDFGRRYFLNVAEVGIGATAVRRAEQLRWLRGLRYQAGFWSAVPTYRHRRVKVITDRRELEDDALMVVVANGQFFGRGYNIAPKATVMDGLADVQVFSIRRRDVPTVFLQVRSGNHLKRRDVRRMQSKRVSITADIPAPVEADGEFLGTTPIDVTIVPGLIDFKF